MLPQFQQTKNLAFFASFADEECEEAADRPLGLVADALFLERFVPFTARTWSRVAEVFLPFAGASEPDRAARAALAKVR